MDFFTLIACGVIIAAFIGAWRYVSTTSLEQLEERRQWMEQLPSAISTLGVLGTFLGITIGLLHFNPGNLNQSIPQLLAGLKTAFFTSLLGMAESLVLNRLVSRKLQNAQMALIAAAGGDGKKATTLRDDVEQIKDELEETKGHIQELKDSIDQTGSELPRLTALLLTTTTSLTTIANRIDELSETVARIEDNGNN